MAPRRPTASREGVLDERASSAGLLLALLGQQAMRRLRAVHTAHDLSPRQFQLLGLLHDRGPMSQRDLGGVMDVDPSILVTLLNPLEARGHLSRQRDPADRRRHIVTLTTPGEAHLVAAARAQRDAENALFAGLSADQREQLRALLLALRDTLDIAGSQDCQAAETTRTRPNPEPGGGHATSERGRDERSGQSPRPHLRGRR